LETLAADAQNLRGLWRPRTSRPRFIDEINRYGGNDGGTLLPPAGKPK